MAWKCHFHNYGNLIVFFSNLFVNDFHGIEFSCCSHLIGRILIFF